MFKTGIWADSNGGMFSLLELLLLFLGSSKHLGLYSNSRVGSQAQESEDTLGVNESRGILNCPCLSVWSMA